VAGRAKYTEADKAKVFTLLAANDGNVKRTSRESGYPENTVRRWRNEFKETPPSLEAVETAMGEFVEDAERIRGKALVWVEEMIDKRDPKVKMNDLNNIAGTLTDKLDRARGLDIKRVEHQHHLPSPDEARELMRGFVQEAFALSVARDAEIIDAEIVEQASLPAGK
jgi:transposase-like protein